MSTAEIAAERTAPSVCRQTRGARVGRVLVQRALDAVGDPLGAELAEHSSGLERGLVDEEAGCGSRRRRECGDAAAVVPQAAHQAGPVVLCATDERDGERLGVVLGLLDGDVDGRDGVGHRRVGRHAVEREEHGIGGIEEGGVRGADARDVAAAHDAKAGKEEQRVVEVEGARWGALAPRVGEARDGSGEVEGRLATLERSGLLELLDEATEQDVVGEVAASNGAEQRRDGGGNRVDTVGRGAGRGKRAEHADELERVEVDRVDVERLGGLGERMVVAAVGGCRCRATDGEALVGERRIAAAGVDHARAETMPKEIAANRRVGIVSVVGALVVVE